MALQLPDPAPGPQSPGPNVPFSVCLPLRCYFAVTLEDGTSFDTLPSLVTQLLAVLGRLGNGEHARRSFVSVYATASQVRRATVLGPNDTGILVVHRGGFRVHDTSSSTTAQRSALCQGQRTPPPPAAASPRTDLEALLDSSAS